MSSGDTLLIFTPHANMPPASNYATFDTRNSHLVLDFDASTAESAIFGAELPRHYAGGGITATYVWAGSTATSGNVVWQGAFERGDTATDIDADSFATANSATGAASGTSGAPTYTSIAFTSGAQMDSLAAGESFRFKVTRDAANGSDTMTGDAELIRVELKET